MKDTSEEKEFDVEAFIEYHIGDCSCEHGHECQSCTMKRELKDEVKSLSQRLSQAEAENKKLKEELLGIDLDMRMTDIAEWWGNGHGKKVRSLL